MLMLTMLMDYEVGLMLSDDDCGGAAAGDYDDEDAVADDAHADADDGFHQYFDACHAADQADDDGDGFHQCSNDSHGDDDDDG